MIRCIQCQDVRDDTAFQSNRPGAATRRKVCRRCVKAGNRRRKGRRTLSELRAEAEAARQPTPVQLQRKLLTLLRKLLAVRCAAMGEKPDTIQYRHRYRTDPAYREREIARTWARKAASGVLRTDGRSTRRVDTDGTLDGPTVQALFAAATHCPYCGSAMHPREKTLDHVLPVSRGGLHSITNVVVCCGPCNSSKRTRTPTEMGWADPRSSTAQAHSA
jgi:5-methylcytosine-specific restriction endonuclease McrA